MNIIRRGLMLVLSSPSGAGKTTIARALIEQDNNLKNSVSITTRSKRYSEEDGKDYFFVDTQKFLKMRDKEALLEYAQVFGNYYGTPKKFVFEQLENGFDVIFDIDWQGTQQIAQFARNDLVTIFILPPTLSTLYDRLKSRGEDDDETINERMKDASAEISHWPEYDYVIVNKNFEESLAKITAILEAERLKRTRQIGLAGFVNELRHGT